MPKSYRFDPTSNGADNKRRRIIATEQITETREKNFTLSDTIKQLKNVQASKAKLEIEETELKAEIAAVKAALNIA